MDNPDLGRDCLQKTGTWHQVGPPVGSLPTWHLHSYDWVSGFCWGPSYPCTCDPCSESGLHRTRLGLHHFSLAHQTGVYPLDLLFPISLWNHLLIYLLIFVAALLRYSHTITIHSFKVHNSVVFSIFKELLSDHLSQYQNIFITLKGNPIPTGSHSTFLQTQPQSQATISFLSVSVDFLILDILYKWNHVIYYPL